MEQKVVVITGGAHGIGKCVAQEFQRTGAIVEIIDSAPGDHYYDGPDAAQQLVGRVGNPMDIANMVLFLCSENAGFISGENICIDGGMTRLMIYHGEHGWTLDM